jgi:type IX secretion system PorP/SprF family membrane protein
MYKSTRSAVICALFIVNLSLAQDPAFSQPLVGNIHLNSALAGNNTQSRIAANYRNQWAHLPANYKSGSINYYQYLNKANSYLGLNFLHDNQANIITSSSLSVFYTQNLLVKRFIIKPSLEIAYQQQKLDISKMTFGNMIDPITGFQYEENAPITPSTKLLDLHLGTVFYHKKLLMGFSAHHINQAKYGFFGKVRMPMNLGIQSSYVFEWNQIDLKPFAYYNYQNGFQQLVIGLSTVFFDHWNFALSSLSSSAWIFNIGFQNDGFIINYSYDYSTSSLTNSFSGGAHELGLAIKFGKKEELPNFQEIKSAF